MSCCVAPLFLFGVVQAAEKCIPLVISWGSFASVVCDT